MKTSQVIGLLALIIWIVTWFLAIWVKGLGWQLFMTGGFCLFLAIIFAKADTK